MREDGALSPALSQKVSSGLRSHVSRELSFFVYDLSRACFRRFPPTNQQKDKVLWGQECPESIAKMLVNAGTIN
jgi:hypothetical protein